MGFCLGPKQEYWNVALEKELKFLDYTHYIVIIRSPWIVFLFPHFLLLKLNLFDYSFPDKRPVNEMRLGGGWQASTIGSCCFSNP